MKKPILFVLGLFSFASSGVFAADFTWALSGVETNDYFVIQDSGKNGFNKDVMPGSEDDVFINKSSNILLSGDKDVTISSLALPSVGNVTSSFIVKDGAKITVGRSAASSISLGGRDGGTGSYKTTDFSCGYLTVDGGELRAPNYKILVGCSAGANSKSLITLEDGLIETKGADIALWGQGGVVVNGGIFRNKGMVSVGNSYAQAYEARKGFFYLNDGMVTNNLDGSFKVRPTGRYIQNGGTFIVNANGGIQYAFSNSSEKYGVMELRRGVFISKDVPFGQGTKYSTTPAALRVSIYGTMDLVSVKGLYGSAQQFGYTNQQPLVEHVISNGKITPITVDYPTPTGYTNYSVDNLKKWIRPDGGVQLISTNSFAIFRNNRRHMTNADANTTYPNQSVWAYGDLGRSGGYNEDGCTLLEGIKIEGEIETPVPFGYIELPSVKTNKLNSAYVDMNIIPQGNATFSSLVEEMTAAGHQVEVTDENTVRVYLPIERLGNQVTDRKVFFDFTRQDVPYYACTGVITTNALVSAVSYTPVFDLGLRIILR